MYARCDLWPKRTFRYLPKIDTPIVGSSRYGDSSVDERRGSWAIPREARVMTPVPGPDRPTDAAIPLPMAHASRTYRETFGATRHFRRP